jgi:hypothetical protein
VVIIGRMGDDKPKPVDDLKAGLGLLFRAAKGAVDALPTNKLEDVAKDAAKEVARAFESIGTEVEKVVSRATGSPPPQHAAPPAPPPPTEASTGGEPRKEEPKQYDDGYAPDPSNKGPRVG